MNVLGFIAETFNFIIINLYAVLQNFFQINFSFFSSVVSYTYLIEERFSKFYELFSEVLQCCYHDFVIFLYEVISIVRVITQVISKFIFKTYCKGSYVVSNILFYVNLIWLCILDLIYFMNYCSVQVYENFAYLIQLIFTSLLLILQAGPNILIFIGEIIVSTACCAFIFLRKYIASLIQDIYSIYIKSGEAIYSVPVKAYFGALLFIIIFYQYKYVINILKTYFIHLFSFFKHVGILLHLCLCICLKPILKLFTIMLNQLKCVCFSSNEDVFYDASPNVSDSSHLQKRQNKYFKYFKTIFFRYPFVSRKCVEEQIEQLQKELLAEREKHLCIVCLDRPKNIILYPCRHMCICQECCLTLQSQHHGCPLCRHGIYNVYHVYT